MIRRVSAYLDLEVIDPARLFFTVAVARGSQQILEETLALTVDGAPVDLVELPLGHDGRMHLLDARPGRVVLRYNATVSSEPIAPVFGRIPDPLEELQYLLPSRYCESDRLLAIASAEFAGIGSRRELLAAVSSWVGNRLFYVTGSSGPTDGAVDTLLAGAGVCRDYAHLTVALLRALEVPARLAAVYAPGLSPMDFHAVAEALVDGEWLVVDSTLLAPRSSLVRISTGRDAADTAFLTNFGGRVNLIGIEVTAIVDGLLPSDDVLSLVRLS
ncbi:MAG: transglutaminase [Jatrophihabitantaceae bacterium]|nr:transglutaminase [Jatrophihabitantaceae bacterium]